MADKITLSKKDRMDVCWRHQFLQGSWNYERMQNGGWCYSIIPAIKKLYKTEEDRAAALKRHLEFYNTHPYVSAPVMGVTLALEEERANGMPVDDQTVQGVKVGMMGPLAGVGDPVFWFTVRPILRAIGASTSVMEFETTRIDRSMANTVNRWNNCDIANEMKAMTASAKQIEDIAYVIDKAGIEILDSKTADVAQIRLENPELTLNELADVYFNKTGQTISKSGLHHRFKKIKDEAARLRQMEEE